MLVEDRTEIDGVEHYWLLNDFDTEAKAIDALLWAQHVQKFKKLGLKVREDVPRYGDETRSANDYHLLCELRKEYKK